MSITDWQKYLLKLKLFIQTKYGALYQYVSPKISFLCKETLNNKEAIIKLSIPLLIIGLGLYACTASQRIVLKNISDIFEISDEIRDKYTGKPDYWGLSTQTAINDNFIPKKFIRKDKIVLSSGDEILIGEGLNADVIMPRSMSFDIVLKGLNKAQCIAHGEAPISHEDQVKLLSISVVNNLGAYSFEWGGTYKLPINKYALKDICADADNILIWSIK